MTVEEIKAQFDALEQEVNTITEEIEQDAHLEFINSLKQLVRKY